MCAARQEGSTGTVEQYLRRLAAGDVPGVLELFAADGVVSSPMHGEIPAREFYPELAATIQRSNVTPLEVFVSTEDQQRVAVRFRYDWTVGTGAPTCFDCVDVITLSDDGLIRELRIVYDTHPLRTAWQAALDSMSDSSD